MFWNSTNSPHEKQTVVSTGTKMPPEEDKPASNSFSDVHTDKKEVVQNTYPGNATASRDHYTITCVYGYYSPYFHAGHTCNYH